MALLYDVVPLDIVTGYVREVFNLEAQRNHWEILDALLPVRYTTEIELETITGQLADQNEAQVRSWDAEAEISGRQTFSKVKFELPPISRKSRIGERERIAQVLFSRGNADIQMIQQAIYDDATLHARAIAARWARMRADALFNASLAFTETNDRIVQSVSYGRTGGHTVTAGTLWTSANHATAKPIDDLQTWVQTFISTNGFAPAAMITSSKVVSGLAVNDQIKSILQTPAGGPTMVTLPAISLALQALGLPPLITFDSQTRRAGTKTRLTADTALLMVADLGDPIGNFWVGPTAESLELVQAGVISGEAAPGLAVTVEKSDDPVAVWTKVSGVGFPFVANPNFTFLATVSS